MVEQGKLFQIDNNDVKNVYKYMWPVDLKHASLAVIGMVQVSVETVRA